MSGVEVPRLGSYRDSVLRNFMTNEASKSLKREQLTLAIALLNCSNDQARNVVKNIWKDLVKLELGYYSDEFSVEENERDQQMIAEYERMKTKAVTLTRTGNGLTVSGLSN